MSQFTFTELNLNLFFLCFPTDPSKKEGEYVGNGPRPQGEAKGGTLPEEEAQPWARSLGTPEAKGPAEGHFSQ